jgi:hypothetical protein
MLFKNIDDMNTDELIEYQDKLVKFVIRLNIGFFVIIVLICSILN